MDVLDDEHHGLVLAQPAEDAEQHLEQAGLPEPLAGRGEAGLGGAGRAELGERARGLGAVGLRERRSSASSGRSAARIAP